MSPCWVPWAQGWAACCGDHTKLQVSPRKWWLCLFSLLFSFFPQLDGKALGPVKSDAGGFSMKRIRTPFRCNTWQRCKGKGLHKSSGRVGCLQTRVAPEMRRPSRKFGRNAYKLKYLLQICAGWGFGGSAWVPVSSWQLPGLIIMVLLSVAEQAWNGDDNSLGKNMAMLSKWPRNMEKWAQTNS